ncbi:MAG: hypothetical protein FWH05_02525 [Oscillospiraceae bacterium]|nr:hypothetical protein [Oscillospiraceae bacterium]
MKKIANILLAFAMSVSFVAGSIGTTYADGNTTVTVETVLGHDVGDTEVKVDLKMSSPPTTGISDAMLKIEYSTDLVYKDYQQSTSANPMTAAVQKKSDNDSLKENQILIDLGCVKTPDDVYVPFTGEVLVTLIFDVKDNVEFGMKSIKVVDDESLGLTWVDTTKTPATGRVDVDYVVGGIFVGRYVIELPPGEAYDFGASNSSGDVPPYELIVKNIGLDTFLYWEDAVVAPIGGSSGFDIAPDDGVTQGMAFAYGASAKFTITPKDGLDFANYSTTLSFSSSGEPSDSLGAFTVKVNITDKPIRTVTLVASAGGIQPENPRTGYEVGAPVSIAAPPPSNNQWTFEQWTASDDVGGEITDDILPGDKATTSPAQFNMPDKDVTLVANYVQNTRTVTIVSGEGGGVAPPPTTALIGETVWVTAPTANEGYAFDKWTAANTNTGEDVTEALLGANTETSPVSFTMPNYNVTLTAHYKETATSRVKGLISAGSIVSGIIGQQDLAYMRLFVAERGAEVPATASKANSFITSTDNGSNNPGQQDLAMIRLYVAERCAELNAVAKAIMPICSHAGCDPTIWE